MDFTIWPRRASEQTVIFIVFNSVTWAALWKGSILTEIILSVKIDTSAQCTMTMSCGYLYPSQKTISLS